MKNNYSFIFLPLIFFYFSGCALRYEHHEPRKIVFKTASFAYADAGFVYDNGKEVKVEILVAGHPAFTLELGNKICLDGFCFKKKEFISKYLNSQYPENIVHQIFLGQPIFNKVSYKKETDGFSQTIFKEEHYQISYNVTHDTIRFKDSISKILIKTQRLEE